MRFASNAGVPAALGDAKTLAIRSRQTAPSSGAAAAGADATEAAAEGVAEAFGVGSQPVAVMASNAVHERLNMNSVITRMGTSIETTERPSRFQTMLDPEFGDLDRRTFFGHRTINVRCDVNVSEWGPTDSSTNERTYFVITLEIPLDARKVLKNKHKLN